MISYGQPFDFLVYCARRYTIWLDWARGSFDYIIAGTGSAGCVLADRLSQDGRNKILVAEAGIGGNKFWIKVPLGYGMSFSIAA